jgi:sterol desaturase/sphingolipid hydroxylase (fatty acid hydroxylase superfamily)
MLDQLLAAALALAVLALLFGPLERAFPARPQQPIFRPELHIDLFFFLGQRLVFAGLAALALTALYQQLAPYLPELLVGEVRALPLPLRLVLGLVLGDLITYWFHRACHNYEILWRFHAVHHSAHHLDWLAAHREHPLDGFFTQLCVNLPAILLGLPGEAIGGVIVARGLWAILIHANVRLPLGPLRHLFGAPELHHWHHARVAPTRHNFANLAPYLDHIFGTYHRPQPGPETYPLGLADPWPRGYLAQLLRPFAPTPTRTSDDEPSTHGPQARPRG